MTAGDEPTAVALALRVGGMTALGMDVQGVLTNVCGALPQAIGATGALFVLVAMPDVAVVASDARAGWLGELQHRSAAGPMFYALRSAKPMITPDLTRVGPPEVAAAAAETGLVTSVVVPLVVGERRLGGLQLLGDVDHPVGVDQLRAVRPLIEVLSARMVDVLALHELESAVAQATNFAAAAPPEPTASAEPMPAAAHGEPDAATAAIEVVPPPVTGTAPATPRSEDGRGSMGWFDVEEPVPDHSGSANSTQG
jgi:hypothetical protein